MHDPIYRHVISSKVSAAIQERQISHRSGHAITANLNQPLFVKNCVGCVLHGCFSACVVASIYTTEFPWPVGAVSQLPSFHAVVWH